MKAECYSEDFICSSSSLIPIEKRKYVVRNRTTGIFAIIDFDKNVLGDFADLNSAREKLLVYDILEYNNR